MNFSHRTVGVSPLHEAKDRVRIPDVARLRRWEWQPGKSCRCPYRPDRDASGSVFADGKLFKDFATGETLDAPALLAKVEDLPASEACKLFIELAGNGTQSGGTLKRRPPGRETARAASPPPAAPKLPVFAPLTAQGMELISQSRHVSLDSVVMASDAGLLHGCRWFGNPCWVVTDKARWVAQARRFDRGRFHLRDSNEEGPKAWTFKGGRAGWPVGLVETVERDVPSIALCEGGPDLLAACHFIIAQSRRGAVAPIAMLGAAARIVSDALPLFAGKRVRIFAHADPPKPETGRCAGTEAAFRWQEQLTAAGATVDVFDLSGLRLSDGTPLNDLNDLTRCHPDDWRAEAPELETLMHF